MTKGLAPLETARTLSWEAIVSTAWRPTSLLPSTQSPQHPLESFQKEEFTFQSKSISPSPTPTLVSLMSPNSELSTQIRRKLSQNLVQDYHYFSVLNWKVMFLSNVPKVMFLNHQTVIHYVISFMLVMGKKLWYLFFIPTYKNIMNSTDDLFSETTNQRKL